MRVKKKGYTLDLHLNEFGYKSYYVECIYIYDRNADKYKVEMWLCNNQLEDRFKIDSQKMDEIYITCERDKVIDHLVSIVEGMCKDKSIEKYIERFEFTTKCFDYGCDHYMDVEYNVD